MGIGDDGAVLQPSPATQTVIAVDTLVCGVHFPEHASAYDIGWRTLAVNLSDLAAMGATPRWFTLALTLPELDQHWLEEFSKGLFACAAGHDISLVGGDTTAGPLTLTVQVVGEVPTDQYLSRAGAQAGDAIYLTGFVGDAMAGLGIMQERYAAQGARREYLLNRFMKPSPRVDAGLAIAQLASAAIDISDGLVADLGHICAASQCCAELQLRDIPVSPQLVELLGKEPAQTLALSSGDDYEICFTVGPNFEPQLKSLFETLGLNITRIGHIKTGTGVVVITADGSTVAIGSKGYQHFS